MANSKVKPIRLAWYFQTFLMNSPRVGPLDRALGDEGARHHFMRVVAEDRLLRLFVSGNISRELNLQFVEWMKSNNVIERV